METMVHRSFVLYHCGVGVGVGVGVLDHNGGLLLRGLLIHWRGLLILLLFPSPLIR